METLVVTGFDDNNAAEFGWQVGDSVMEINGQPVTCGPDFRARLEEVKTALPITFTVGREKQRRNTVGEGSPTLPAQQPLHLRSRAACESDYSRQSSAEEASLPSGRRDPAVATDRGVLRRGNTRDTE